MGTGHFKADCDSEAEQQLVRRAQAGEEEAFGALVQRYQRPVYRLAYRLLMHHADAEDVVQETFLRAYRYLPSFDPQRSFRRWLYAIAVRECHRLQRGRGRLPVVELDESLPDPAWASSPEQVYAQRELGAEIQRALLTLSWHQRTALILSAVEGLPSAEVAEVLGCSAPTARIHLFRARKNLRRALHRYLEGPELARTSNEPDQAPAKG
jgi:RNA polymerase sigma-70 factor (ECF subfamily)